MRATKVDREVFRGDTVYFKGQVYQDVVTGEVFTVPVTNPPTQPPPGAAPYNLTGCRLWVTAKYQYPDADSQALFELDNMALGGVTVTNVASGAYTVNGAPSSTAAQPDSEVTLRLDTQLKDLNSNIFTVEHGDLKVVPDVTRATS